MELDTDQARGNTDRTGKFIPLHLAEVVSDLSGIPPLKKKGKSTNIISEWGKNAQFSAQHASGKCNQVCAVENCRCLDTVAASK